MKYVSIDLETTGINPKTPENILGISMVIEDTAQPDVPLKNLPHFTCMIEQSRYSGEPYALALNAWIFTEICNHRKGIETKYPVLGSEWESMARDFLTLHFGGNRAVAAGKNAAGFDLLFLPESLKRKFLHRVVDPGSVCIDWSQDKPMDLGQLKKRCGLEGVVSHDMYEDALDVIAILRTTYGAKNG